MSNVTNFQLLLAFIMGHISTKLHHFLLSSFRDFVRTVTYTDAAKTFPALSIAGTQVNIYITACACTSLCV